MNTIPLHILLFTQGKEFGEVIQVPSPDGLSIPEDKVILDTILGDSYAAALNIAFQHIRITFINATGRKFSPPSTYNTNEIVIEYMSINAL